MAPTALHYGTEEQKARLLPPMARGEVVWCQGYSEPDAGSDLANISTRARLDGRRVGGQRPEGLDHVRAARRLDVRDRANRAGLRPGTRACPTCWSRWTSPESRSSRSARCSATAASTRSSSTAREPARDNVLGAPGEGWKAAMTTLGHERATSVLNYQFSFRREMASAPGPREAAGARRRTRSCGTGSSTH